MGCNFLLTMLTTLQLRKHFPLISLLGTLHRDKNFFFCQFTITFYNCKTLTTWFLRLKHINFHYLISLHPLRQNQAAICGLNTSITTA